MSISFLHTADWQLGKPFAGVEDGGNRTLIQRERLNVLERIGEVARQHYAKFIVVAGDVFDSPSANKTTVATACSRIGAMGVPVLVIPGNHDHGGPGCLWEQDFFRQEQRALAPNLQVLLHAEAVEVEGVVILPCPLQRRHESTDTTAWLRSTDLDLAAFGGKPRVVIAHGSVQGFAAASVDDDDFDGSAPNQIDLERLPSDGIDYIALGDWHGMKQVGPKAWYSGTPEQDRFSKGDEYSATNVLSVTVSRGAAPSVVPIKTGRFQWHALTHTFAHDDALGQLEHDITERVGTRAGEDLMRLDLSGSLGIGAMSRLEQLIESWDARLLRLRLLNRTSVAPTDDEIDQLANSGLDPLIARVAAELRSQAAGQDEHSEIAKIALRELFSLSNARTVTS